MSELLRTSLKNVPSLNAVAKATGVQRASLIRFRNGRCSLRLDIADRLAEHFRIRCVRQEDE